MTVLKPDSGPSVRAERYGGRPTIVTPARDPLAEELTRLREELTACRYELRDALVEREAACARALATGRAEGAAQASDREAERTETLRNGMAEALANLAERWREERDLAVEISQAALAAMIGDAIPYRELVVATAARHAEALTADTVVRLNVSAADFPNDDALAALRGLGRRVDVIANPALAEGACRFDLTLGRLDASIGTQSAAIADLLAGAQR